MLPHYQSKIITAYSEFGGEGRDLMADESNIYKQAMERIDDLVEEVVQTCLEVADDNHYERIWVLEQFRERFNKAKRTNSI